MAEILVDKGAQLNMLTRKEKITPIAYAIELNLPEFSNLFRKKIEDSLQQELREIKQKNPETNYLALLLPELLQEITYFATEEKYRELAKQ